MDNLAKAYKVVRDATVCNDDLSSAEKIAVLELIKHELVTVAFDLIYTDLNDK